MSTYETATFILPSSTLNIPMTNAEELQTIAEIIKNFHPIYIGDPMGDLGDTHYFSPHTSWILAVVALLLAIPLVWFLTRRLRERKTLRRALRIGVPAVITAFAFAVGLAMHYYWGGPFNYSAYAIPSAPADVLIWFTGSDDGAYGCQYMESNYIRSYEQFGYNRSALFNFSDIDQALTYADKLPKGSRIMLRGHSMGASSALRFAQRYQGDILLIDSRDPTSWFGKINDRPANVAHWRNVLPEHSEIMMPKAPDTLSNYWGPFNMANVFRWLGGPWETCDGAANVMIPGSDHHTVGNNLRDDYNGKWNIVQ